MSAHAAERGVSIGVRRFLTTTRTAEDAARAIGCAVAEIVKSLVFLADGRPVVVLCSGVDRVDEAKLRVALGARTLRRATAGEAKALTGYAIGGVPPFAHAMPCRVVFDRGLEAHRTLWAAAGLPDAVFPIAPADLRRLAEAVAADVSYRSPSSPSPSSSNSSE